MLPISLNIPLNRFPQNKNSLTAAIDKQESGLIPDILEIFFSFYLFLFSKIPTRIKRKQKTQNIGSKLISNIFETGNFIYVCFKYI